jgi:disulfide bond formation protein DsbB
MSYSAPKSRSRFAELLTVENAGFVIAGVSLATLAAAWTFQLLGFEPCELCYKERIPYYAAVPAGLLAALLANKAPKLAALILAAICAALLYDAGLSAYHAGAEWHFWPGPETCSGGGVQASPSLSSRLTQNHAVRCDVAALRILGISLAGYLVLLSIALAGLGGAALIRNWRAEPVSRSTRKVRAKSREIDRAE